MHVHVQVMEVANLTVHDDAPWDTSQSVGRALLTPTTIYVNDVLKLHNEVCALLRRASPPVPSSSTAVNIGNCASVTSAGWSYGLQG
jgi:hypothetical protein